MVKKYGKQHGSHLTATKHLYLHPSIHWGEGGAYSIQSISAAKAVSLAIGHNPGLVTTLTQDTQMAKLSQQSGTHFANLRRTTGRICIMATTKHLTLTTTLLCVGVVLKCRRPDGGLLGLT